MKLARPRSRVKPYNLIEGLPRLLILAAYLVVIMNLGLFLGRGTANIIEKATFLAAGVTFALLRPVSFSVLMLMASSIILVVTLGAATDYPDFNWGTLIASLTQFIIIYTLLAFFPTQKDSNWFMIVAALAPVASAGLGLFYQALGIQSAWSYEWGTNTPRFQGSLIPAFLSGLSMCGAFASLHLAAAGKHRLFYAVLVADLAVLLLAGGRGPLAVAFVVGGASLLLSASIRPSTKLFAFLGGIPLLLLLALALGGTAATRFMTSGDKGRELMWGYLQPLADRYPSTGIGWGHQFEAVPREILVQTGSAAAHNDFLRLQVELGQVGMPIFYILLTGAVLIVARRNSRSLNLTVILAYLGFLFLSRTENALAAPSHFPLVILAAMTVLDSRRRAASMPRPRKLPRFNPSVMSSLGRGSAERFEYEQGQNHQ